MKAILTVGCSGSGKSTFARKMRFEYAYNVLERDEIRKQIYRELHCEIHPYENFWSKWDWKLEPQVTERFNRNLMMIAQSRHNVVISDTNLNPVFREQLITTLKSFGYEVELHHCFAEYKKLLEYDNKRKDSVGQQVIAKQYEDYMKQFGESQFGIIPHVHQIGLPSAAIFDVDGTLALHTSTRKPYDWDRVGEDSLCIPTASILDCLCDAGFEIIILSGRDSVCMPQTKKWLDDNNIIWHQIYMRPEGDMRPDWVIKNELFQNNIAGNYNVEMWFDDRPVVVRLVHQLGIRCYAVGNQHKEF